jgi:hypothetical protein
MTNEMSGNLKGTAYVPLFKAEELLTQLPVAELRPIFAQSEDGLMSEMPTKRGVFVDNAPYEVVSDRYKPVQHSEAFKQVCEVIAGVDLQLMVKVSWYGDRAQMSVVVEDDIADTVRFGFYVSNVHDGLHAVTYSFAMDRVQRYKEVVQHQSTTVLQDGEDAKPKKGGYSYIELVGFRQICSNGMKIRVPMDEVMAATGTQATELQMSVKRALTEVWETEENRIRVKSILHVRKKISHKGDVVKKLEEQKKVMEVLVALKDPVKRMIARAQNKHVGPKEAMDVLVSYLGVGTARRIVQCVADGECDPLVSAWDVYNSFTYYATHKADSVREINRVENASADYLVLLSRSPADAITAVATAVPTVKTAQKVKVKTPSSSKSSKKVSK